VIKFQLLGKRGRNLTAGHSKEAGSFRLHITRDGIRNGRLCDLQRGRSFLGYNFRLGNRQERRDSGQGEGKKERRSHGEVVMTVHQKSDREAPPCSSEMHGLDKEPQFTPDVDLS
jgi:hypothetical protein